MEIRYHLRDWMRDWQSVQEASLTVPKEKENEWFRTFFLSHYHTPAEARWRCGRIVAALRYFETHADSFEKAGYAIVSSKRATLSKYITSALYRFFGAADDADILNPPTPNAFIEAAQEHERNDP
jgi:hypothetical protein